MPSNMRPRIALDSPQGATVESLSRDVERLAGVLSNLPGIALSGESRIVIPQSGRWRISFKTIVESTEQVSPLGYRDIYIRVNGVRVAQAAVDTRSTHLQAGEMREVVVAQLSRGDAVVLFADGLGTVTNTLPAGSDLILLAERIA